MVRLAAILLALPLALAGQITLDWDDDEVTEITWNGDDYAQNVNGGTPFCCWINYADAQAYTVFDSSPSSKTENVDGWSLTYRPGTDYELGVDVVLSQPCDDCIDMEVTISNDGAQPITYIGFLPFELTNPSVPTTSCASGNRFAGSAFGPAQEMQGEWGKWIFWIDDFDDFWHVMVPCSGSSAVDFDIQLASGSTLVLDDQLSPQIGVGGSKTITLHMEFAAEADSAADIVPEAYAAWRARYPIAYKAADARPWLSWFMASESNVDADGVGVDNPRGYIHFTDWTDEATVYTNMLAKADEIVSRANGMSPKAQGVMVWDIEGNEFAHSMTYVGDPRSMCPAGTPDDTTGISPDMCYDNGTGELLQDAMMRKFREGGLRIGLTLRPQSFQYGTELPATCETTGAFDATFATADFTDTFVDIDRALTPRGNRGCRCADDGVSWVCNYNLFWQIHFDTQAEVIANLRAKIQYAYERWGATHFYVDTNNLSGTYWHGIFYQLAREFPDVLIMPEWEEATYIACCKPYDQLNLNITGPTQAELDIHPAGSIFLNLQDGDREANAAAIRMGMRHGSLGMARGWFGSPAEQTFLQEQYTLAVQENGIVTLSTGERFEATIPTVERPNGSCYPHELVVRFAASTEALNACNPLLEQGCESTTVCRSTDSPCDVADHPNRDVHWLEVQNALRETCSVGAVQ